MGLPDCVNQSTCREVMISLQVPLDWALPLYGFAMPGIVALTIATNSFIVLVLSHRYLRTPTNYILLAMAITELLTGLSCLPWLLYYYTLDGRNALCSVEAFIRYQTDRIFGLPAFWCSSFPYMATLLPSIFHTAACWLTVYLALQRCIYITLPKLVRSYCTIKRSKQAIMVICIVSILIFLPEFFGTYNQTFLVKNHRHNGLDSEERASERKPPSYEQSAASSTTIRCTGCTHSAHTLPCILLVCFTWKLISAIRLADKRHAYLIARSNTSRKYTVESADAFETERSMKRSTRSTRQRTSFSESKRVQGLKQNTRMLLAVIFLFLLTEIPAALIFSVHVSAVAFQISFIHYALLNKLLIVRNVLIVLSYPFRFAIYCGMSTQFRELARQMLSERVFLPFGKKSRNLMKNTSSSININSTRNQNTATAHEHTQLSEERKYSASAAYEF
ncbi:FMRFamide receptor [Aphelenchoides fujianensis]|nr:FMRFamide receptor [Aphelenchoides fujianensis]